MQPVGPENPAVGESVPIQGRLCPVPDYQCRIEHSQQSRAHSGQILRNTHGVPGAGGGPGEAPIGLGSIDAGGPDIRFLETPSQDLDGLVFRSSHGRLYPDAECAIGVEDDVVIGEESLGRSEEWRGSDTQARGSPAEHVTNAARRPGPGTTEPSR